MGEPKALTTSKRTLFWNGWDSWLSQSASDDRRAGYAAGRALGIQLRGDLSRRPRVLVGKDTRLSGYLFETAVASGLVSVGADVHLVGPLPTPGIAFLTTGMRCDAGIVISASHNPYQDNGIKLFARDGYKLPDERELELERLILGESNPDLWAQGDGLGRAYRIDDATGRYSFTPKVYSQTAL